MDPIWSQNHFLKAVGGKGSLTESVTTAFVVQPLDSHGCAKIWIYIDNVYMGQKDQYGYYGAVSHFYQL